ncbi:hypothetical protein OAX78_01145 [Planctomycetota bacterium]|nr:hypothetical protein [Planctomycetota bacterium]
MFRMARHVLPALSIMLVVASPALAQERTETGAFERLDSTGDLRRLFLDGNRSFPMAGDVYRRNRRVLESLDPGDVITVHLLGRAVVSVERGRGAVAAEDADVDELNSNYKGLEPLPNGDFLLEVENGRTYQLPAAVHAEYASVIHFLSPGDAIYLTFHDRLIASVEKGHRSTAGSLDPRLDAAVRASVRGDVVFINNEEFRYLYASDDFVLVEPRVANSDPAQYGSRMRYPKSEIMGFVNQAAAQRGDGELGPGLDVFVSEDVRVGDTVGVGFHTGQLIALDDATYTLKRWRNDEWVDVRPEAQERAGVPAIRRVWLQSIWNLELGDGALHLKTRRRRVGTRTGLEFEVEIWHDAPGQLLVDLELQIKLGGVGMTRDREPQKTETAVVPVLFPGQRRVVRYEVQDDTFLDGRVSVRLRANNLVEIKSEGAKPFIVGALASETDREVRRGIHAAAGENGDSELVRYLISRTLAADEPAELELLHEGLVAFGDVLPRTIVETASGLDRNVEVVRMSRGKLESIPIPTLAQAVERKRAEIRLLAALPGMLGSGDTSREIFRLYREREDLKEAIQSAFKGQPAVAVQQLLDTATDINDGSPDSPAGAAAELIRSLGDTVLDELFREMRRRTIDPAPFEAAREQAGPRRAAQVVGRALDAVVNHRIEQRLGALDRRCDNAAGMLADERLEEALDELRAVLTEEPEHALAHELLPDVLVTLARKYRAAGQRGDAALLFEQSLDYLADNKKTLARGPLGEMYLEAAREELEEVVIRDTPHDLGTRLRVAAMGTSWPGSEANDKWYRIDLDADTVGFVRKKVSTPGPDTVQCSAAITPFDPISRMITLAKELSPAHAQPADELLGHLHAREAVTKYEASNYKGALVDFDRVLELAPADERLSLRKWCWAMANTGPLAAVGAVAIFGMGFVLLQVFSKPKKVEFTGDFKHYGSDRSRVERSHVDDEIDDAGPPTIEIDDTGDGEPA